jgi:hypothetical protein
MKRLLILSVILFFGIAPVYSNEIRMELPVKCILDSGDILQVPIDSQIKRITISIRNLIDEESVVYRSERFEGKERPENEIGPKFVRTSKLDPQIKDENQTIKRDRKEIVLITEKTDEVYITVKKGKVEVEIGKEQ